MKQVRCCKDQSEATLQNALSDDYLDMFQSSSDNANECMEVVTGFIAKLMDDDVPMVTVHIVTNQKPYVDKFSCTALNACTAAYNLGPINSYMEETGQHHTG